MGFQKTDFVTLGPASIEEFSFFAKKLNMKKHNFRKKTAFGGPFL